MNPFTSKATEPARVSREERLRAALTGPPLLIALLVLAVGRLWLMPLGSSFWLDECATFWAIKAGPSEIVSRSLLFLHSPLHCFITWASGALGGYSEAALRLPSVFGLALAAWLLYRLASALYDRETALVAAAIFSCLEYVRFAAGDARPYALALAAVNGALLMLWRWLERERWRYALAYAALGALSVHLHFLLAYMIAVHGIYVLWRGIRWTGVRIAQMAGAAALFLALVAPLWPNLVFVVNNSTGLSWAPAPTVDMMIGYVVPLSAVVALCAGVGVAWMSGGRFSLQTRPAPAESTRLAVVVLLAPPILLGGVSWFTPVNVVLPRYLLPTASGAAMLLARSIIGWQPAPARYAAAAVFVWFSMLGLSGGRFWPPHNSENWRDAIRAANFLVRERNEPVLVRAGFTESAVLERLTDTRHADYLLAPLAAYPLHAGKPFALPYQCDSPALAFVEANYVPMLKRESGFLLLLRDREDCWAAYLAGRMTAEGFRTEATGEFGTIGLWRFSRDRR